MSNTRSAASAAIPLYRIRNWQQIYENHSTKKVRSLAWVATPNKHDGRGFRRLMRMENGLALYGAWHLILQVASKMPQRGLLADIDGPLSAQDIADKTGAPASLIDSALAACASPEIGWIERVSTALHPDGAAHCPDVAADHPDVAADRPAEVPQQPDEVPQQPDSAGDRGGSSGESAATDRQTDRELHDTTGKDIHTGGALSNSRLAEEWIGTFLAAGVMLSEDDVMLAYRGGYGTVGFLHRTEDEQLQIIGYTKMKAAGTSAKYMGLPFNLLVKGEWKRTGPGRLIPEPRKQSKSEIAQQRAAEAFRTEEDPFAAYD